MNIRHAMKTCDSEEFIKYLRNMPDKKALVDAFVTDRTNADELLRELFNSAHNVDVFLTVFALLGHQHVAALLTRKYSNLLHYLTMPGANHNRTDINRLDLYLFDNFRREFEQAALQPNIIDHSPIYYLFHYNHINRITLWLNYIQPERMVLAMCARDLKGNSILSSYEKESNEPQKSEFIANFLKKFKFDMDRGEASLIQTLERNIDKNSDCMLAYLELTSAAQVNDALLRQSENLIHITMSYYPISILAKILEKASDEALVCFIKAAGKLIMDHSGIDASYRHLYRYYFARLLQTGQIEERKDGKLVPADKAAPAPDKKDAYRRAFAEYKLLLNTPKLDKDLEQKIRLSLIGLGDEWLKLDLPESYSNARECYRLADIQRMVCHVNLGDYFANRRKKDIDMAAAFYFGEYEENYSPSDREFLGKKFLGLPPEFSANPAKLSQLQSEVRGDLLFETAKEKIDQSKKKNKALDVNQLITPEIHRILQNAASHFSVDALDMLVKFELYQAKNNGHIHTGFAISHWEQATEVAEKQIKSSVDFYGAAPEVGKRTVRSRHNRQLLRGLLEIFIGIFKDAEVPAACKKKIALVLKNHYDIRYILTKQEVSQVEAYLPNPVRDFFNNVRSNFSFSLNVQSRESSVSPVRVRDDEHPYIEMDEFNKMQAAPAPGNRGTR